MTAGPHATRPRNAAASREALLTAAGTLFSEAGYDKTTVRDIGERAGVDPALIARYFGNKVNLYLATLAAQATEGGPPDEIEDPGALAQWLLGRTDVRGPGPLLQALVRSDTAPEIREAARQHLDRGLVGPLERLFLRRGAPDARLRAEMAVAALAGVLVVRLTGSFDEVRAADRAQLAELLTGVLDALGA